MKCTPRAFCFIFLSVLCCSPSRAQSSDLPAVVAKLHSMRIPEEVEIDVPPEVRALLKELKHELRDLITQIINSPQSSGASPAQLQFALTEQLKKMSIALEPRKTVVYTGSESLTEETWHPYGQIVSIRFEQPDSHPDLLSVVVTLNISCGEDSSLYVFEKKQRAWKLKLEREEDGYADVSGALENLAYRISPSDEHGDWVLLVASSHPWCTSCWNSVHYQVLRPSDQPNKPRMVYEANKDFYRCADKPYQLLAEVGGFSITYQGAMSYGPDLWSRVYIDRFQLHGDLAVRIDPFAKYPEDFIDEWIDLPETEAMQLITRPAKSQAIEWHRRLQEIHKNRGAFVTGYPLRQACKTKIPSWQVGFSIETTGRKNSDLKPTELFFTVIGSDQKFRIDGIAEQRPLGCPGEDKPGGETSPHELDFPD